MGQTDMTPRTFPSLLHPQVDYLLGDDLDRISELAPLVVKIAEIVLGYPVGEIYGVAILSVVEGQLFFPDRGMEAFPMRFTVVGQHTDVICPDERFATEKAVVKAGVVSVRERGFQVCGELLRLFRRNKKGAGPLVFDSSVGEDDVQSLSGVDAHSEGKRLGTLG